ncbi:MAG TPA: PhoU domain-containing protein [Alphaproteobacteria bacterium]|nr:PhoU domain-containing protein [Alphaproteobacteria bacterium]
MQPDKPRSVLDLDLRTLMRLATQTAGLAEDVFDRTLLALAGGDGAALAELDRRRGMLAADKARIAAEVVRILATRHTVAGDLRFVLAIDRVVRDLDRIGACCLTIGRHLAELAEAGGAPKKAAARIDRRARQVRDQLKLALDALIARNAGRAADLRDAIAPSDADPDFEALVGEISAGGCAPAAGAQLLAIVNELDAIAVLVRALAEHVLFWIRGRR